MAIRIYEGVHGFTAHTDEGEKHGHLYLAEDGETVLFLTAEEAEARKRNSNLEYAKRVLGATGARPVNLTHQAGALAAALAQRRGP